MIELFIWTGDEWVSAGIYLKDGGLANMDELVRNGYIVMHMPV